MVRQAVSLPRPSMLLGRILLNSWSPGLQEAGIQGLRHRARSRQTGMTAADFEPGGLADWVASETPGSLLD